MARMRRKADLPCKLCVVCCRPFAWRKRWAAIWTEVRACSRRCLAELRRRKTVPPRER